MKELVVLSGKGGTGKTSLVACYAALAGNAVVADCDVDVPDLPIVLRPEIARQERFVGGALARVKPGQCAACGKCEELCRFDAIRFDGPGNGRVSRTFRVDPMLCEGCGVCAWFCAEQAIAFGPVARGRHYESTSRHGPLFHAQLDPPAANSGKLVSLLRQRARAKAEATGAPLVLTDGSPGVGCPVIASMTGASLVLVVAEASLAGQHDAGRVLTLAEQLGVGRALCVNRASAMPANLVDAVEEVGRRHGARLLERIPEDSRFVEAQHRGRSVIELGASVATAAIEAGWRQLCELLALP